MISSLRAADRGSRMCESVEILPYSTKETITLRDLVTTSDPSSGFCVPKASIQRFILI